MCPLFARPSSDRMTEIAPTVSLTPEDGTWPESDDPRARDADLPGYFEVTTHYGGQRLVRSLKCAKTRRSRLPGTCYRDEARCRIAFHCCVVRHSLGTRVARRLVFALLISSAAAAFGRTLRAQMQPWLADCSIGANAVTRSACAQTRSFMRVISHAEQCVF